MTSAASRSRRRKSWSQRREMFIALAHPASRRQSRVTLSKAKGTCFGAWLLRFAQDDGIRSPSHGSHLRLTRPSHRLQKPHVSPQQQPDIRHAVAQQRDPVRPHPEGPAGVALRIEMHVLEHRLVHHPAAEDLHPARSLARGTAAPVAELALDVHLGGWLGEGKNEGRNRVFVAAEKNRWAKWVSVALRSTKEIPSSTASPSICEKAGSARRPWRRCGRPCRG